MRILLAASAGFLLILAACGGDGSSAEVGSEEWAWEQVMPSYRQAVDAILDEEWNDLYDLWADTPEDCSRSSFVAEMAAMFEATRELLGEDGFQEFRDSLVKESEDAIEEGWSEFVSASEEEMRWVDDEGIDRKAVKTKEGWRFSEPDVCEAFLTEEDSSDSIESVEHQLASIDAGEPVAEDDPAIVRFGAMLNNLEWKCPDSRQHLADLGVTANRTLEEHGAGESLLDTFANVNDLIADTYYEDENAIGESCDWLFADYATTR